jgi:MutS-like protein
MIFMKLEFENGFIPDQIFKELDFRGFLAGFEQKIPLIPNKVLRPLSDRDANEWFSRISNLDDRLSAGEIDTKDLLQQSARLPALENLLPFFQDGHLEPYHLYDLGRFLKEDRILLDLEKVIPLREKEEVCYLIRQILSSAVTDDFSSIRLDVAEKKLAESVNNVEVELSRELPLFEKEILKQTGLKLVYPYPREIEKGHEKLESVKTCPFLEMKDEGAFYRIEYRLTDKIKKLIVEKEVLRDQWSRLMEEKLSGVNKSLLVFYKGFVEYYKNRKQRVFDYLLLDAKEKHGLCLPEFSSEHQLRLKKGRLPKLKSLNPKRYNPLDLELGPGVNLLFGANMTGKTTVLKTLYFQLILTKFGLPSPAESFELPYPSRVEIQLKSSGDLGKGLSGFADEIRFFCQPADPFSIFLIDEMFHSTDPINGVALSEAFLTGLRNSSNIYFCTSHYPEVLSIPGIKFFRMKDFEGEIKSDEIDKFLEQVPYEIESISAGKLKEIVKGSNKPLLIALQFPLPDTIKQNIQNKLKE